VVTSDVWRVRGLAWAGQVGGAVTLLKLESKKTPKVLRSLLSGEKVVEPEIITKVSRADPKRDGHVGTSLPGQWIAVVNSCHALVACPPGVPPIRHSTSPL
jgi:hypothetical protein